MLKHNWQIWISTNTNGDTMAQSKEKTYEGYKIQTFRLPVIIEQRMDKYIEQKKEKEFQMYMNQTVFIQQAILEKLEKEGF